MTLSSSFCLLLGLLCLTHYVEAVSLRGKDTPFSRLVELSKAKVDPVPLQPADSNPLQSVTITVSTTPQTVGDSGAAGAGAGAGDGANAAGCSNGAGSDNVSNGAGAANGVSDGSNGVDAVNVGATDSLHALYGPVGAVVPPYLIPHANDVANRAETHLNNLESSIKDLHGTHTDNIESMKEWSKNMIAQAQAKAAALVAEAQARMLSASSNPNNGVTSNFVGSVSSTPLSNGLAASSDSSSQTSISATDGAAAASDSIINPMFGSLGNAPANTLAALNAANGAGVANTGAGVAGVAGVAAVAGAAGSSVPSGIVINIGQAGATNTAVPAASVDAANAGAVASDSVAPAQGSDPACATSVDPAAAVPAPAAAAVVGSFQGVITGVMNAGLDQSQALPSDQQVTQVAQSQLNPQALTPDQSLQAAQQGAAPPGYVWPTIEQLDTDAISKERAKIYNAIDIANAVNTQKKALTEAAEGVDKANEAHIKFLDNLAKQCSEPTCPLANLS